VPGHHGGNRWELWTCARRGHITYAPDDTALAERLSGAPARPVGRCLRCGDFTLGPPAGRGDRRRRATWCCVQALRRP